MGSHREATGARRSYLVENLCRAGIPRSLSARALTVAVRGIYRALWSTLMDTRRADVCFDPMTALLENVKITGLSKRHGMEEELIATSLAIVVPRLLRLHNSRNVCNDSIAYERLAIRALSCILHHQFPRRRAHKIAARRRVIPINT